MKSMMTIKTISLIALIGAALASPVWAQGGPGMGGGMAGGTGGGPAMQNAGPGAGMGPGAAGPGGPGMGGMRGMRFNQGNTRGWTLMTPEERTAHQSRMRAVTTFDECTAIQNEHRAIVEARAKEKGVTLTTPRRNACETMKSRGFIK